MLAVIAAIPIAIAPGNLGVALAQFRPDFNLFYDFTQMRALQTKGITGDFTMPMDALQRLIQGQPVEGHWISDRTLVLSLCARGAQCLIECRSSLGARAPLPPCKPPAPSLIITTAAGARSSY